ncbi:MAG: hypothetical protein C5B51_31130 [Terriglobia bacterium]|nr:MAG: hypothetical protein C5B51_31130 [Terriglobia bacterium]
MRNKVCCLLIAVFAIFATSAAHAQTTFGSIVGVVMDSSGASVPGAQVTLTNVGTSAKRNTVTGAEGRYEFPNVTPGNYRLEVETQGFKRATREPINLEVGATDKIDFALQVGAASEAIQVTAETPLLQPETSSLGQVVEQRLTNELPLNGRNPLNLVGLVPSVVPQGQAMGTATGANPHAFGNYQIGGGIAQQNATFVDGSPVNTAYINDTMLIPTQDSLQEFKVETNNLTAEYGRFAGGVINMSTKGGTNELHGGAWEFLRNRLLNSSDFFSNLAGLKRPAFTQNEFGANIGGPVYIPHVYKGKDETFFFFNYEGFRLRQGQTFTNTNPTAAQRGGDFSNLRSANGAVIPIYDPLTTVSDPNNPSGYIRTPFANNAIPANRITLPSRLLLGLYPLPNVPGIPFTNANNWIGNAPVGGDNDEVVVRLDHNVSAKQHLFARYSYWTNLNLPIDPFGTGVCKDRCTEKFNTNSFVIDDVYVLSPTTTLDVRGSFLRWSYNRTPKVTGVNVTQYGWPASLNDQISFHVLPMPIITGFDPNSFFGGDGGSSQIFSYDDNERIAGSINKVMGIHSLKFGGEFLRQTHNYGQDNNGAGNYLFDTGFTSSSPINPTGGSGLASYLLGYMSATATSSLNSILFPTGQQLYRGLYIQDNWKATRKLTFNLGLRWELMGSWTERHNQLSYFEPNVLNPVLQAAGLNFPGTIGKVGPRGPYNIDLDYHQFTPRIGVAYQIDSKTVLRAGYGIFFIPNNLSQGLMPTNDTLNAHATPVLASINGGVTPYATFANPFPNGLVLPPGQNIALAQSVKLGQNLTSPMTDNPWGYAQQYNFNIQRELGHGFMLDAAFGGNKGTHLVIGTFPLNNLRDSDLALGSKLLQSVPNPFSGLVQYGTLSASTVTAEQLLRPYPQYTGVSLPSRNNGDSEYYSLQVKLQKRFSSGVSLLVSYTHAKIISDTETNSGWLEGGGVASYQDPTNMKGERSISSFDVPDRLVMGYSVDVPLGKGRKYLVPRVLDPVVGGWGIQGITTIQSGLPLHLTASPNTTYTFGGTQRPNVSASCDKGVSGSPESNLNHWFNTACFSHPANFTFGSEGRNDPNLRANGISNFDLSVYKSFPFGHEGARAFQFRAEFFNMFNTPQFAFPGQTFGTAQFGVVSSQANNPRLVQFALRVKF